MIITVRNLRMTGNVSYKYASIIRTEKQSVWNNFMSAGVLYSFFNVKL